MSRKIFRSFFVLILVIGLAAVQAPQPAHAAGPWFVSTMGDDNNDCLSPSTACATINGALEKPGFVPGDTVRVAIGTYTGTGNEVVLLDKNATLTGGWDASFTTQSGMSTIDGQGARRGITVNSIVTADIESIIVQYGFDSYQGAGIFNTGSLTITNSIITANATSPDYPYGEGGGIWNGWDGISDSGGMLTLNNTSVFDNVAYLGGGISNRQNGSSNGGNVTLNFSTVRDNTASGSGGIFSSSSYGVFELILNNSTVSGNTASVYDGGGINFDGKLTLNNSTVSSNTANGNGGGIYNGNQFSYFLNNSTVRANTAGGSGGGVYDSYGSMLLQNSLIAGNTAGIGGPDCGGTIGSAGYNLIGNTSECTFTPSTGDLLNVDPLLGPLQDNSGSTFTHALQTGSPAIDAGNPAGCTDQDGNLLITDQRGVTRPQGARCDIGAFELEAVSQAIQVTVDIRPGSRVNTINLKHDRLIPVAILSTADFNAPQAVDRNSLTFGKTGDENSLVFCLKHGIKVNRDRLPDLVCYFRTSQTGFEFGDTEGILKGMTVENVSFEGSDSVKILKKSGH